MIVAKLLTILKLLPILLIVVVGLFHLNFNNLKWNGFPSSDGIGTASLLLFAAFLGGETASTMGGEMKNPRRTGPLGILLGVGSVIIFYMLIQTVAQSSLGASLATQKAPLAAVAGTQLGRWGLQLLIVCGIISIFGTLYSGIMAFSRVMFAGAFNGILPKYLSQVHPRYSTPHWSIITLSLIAFILACTGGYRQLIVIGTIAMLLLFVGAVSALIKFKLSKEENKETKGFRVPGGIAIPVIALITLIWFLSHSKQNEIRSAFIFIAFVSMIYLLKIIFKKRRVMIGLQDNS